MVEVITPSHPSPLGEIGPCLGLFTPTHPSPLGEIGPCLGPFSFVATFFLPAFLLCYYYFVVQFFLLFHLVDPMCMTTSDSHFVHGIPVPYVQR